ncbi:hypothetical protein A8990_12226 [Paenibacillus taihuensis]|uniref:Uncharacterized protein n=1 Tax=Paenibacillus taihuensis TaxID=1156355 RepID=A0A3D9RJL4_9BACL|nr:hypothetical protein A8990_12226 [Paenibacillus taihuensis]
MKCYKIQRFMVFYALTISVKQVYNHSITEILVFSNIQLR